MLITFLAKSLGPLSTSSESTVLIPNSAVLKRRSSEIFELRVSNTPEKQERKLNSDGHDYFYENDVDDIIPAMPVVRNIL